MADAHQTPDHDSPHEGPIKTPKQLIWAVVFAFLIPIIGIILLANFVSTGKRPGAGSDGLKSAAVAQRIAPVAGQPEIKNASDVSTMKTGEQVYAAQCSACHAAGVGGAPKFGDAAAWGPRIGQGLPTLVHSAVAGKGAMPAQASDAGFGEFEVSRAVVYMANQGGGKFAEPVFKAPAAAGDAASGAASAAAPDASAASAAK